MLLQRKSCKSTQKSTSVVEIRLESIIGRNVRLDEIKPGYHSCLALMSLPCSHLMDLWRIPK
nr:MAG TPA: hypothetical protein [Caudoviricetes sp.]